MEYNDEYCTVKYSFGSEFIRNRRVVSTTLFLRENADEKTIKKYLKPMILNIEIMNCYLRDLDLILLIYMDAFTISLAEREGFELVAKFLNDSRKYDFIRFGVYNCPMFKEDVNHHYKLFGTITRLLPAFTLPIRALFVIDADTILFPLQTHLLRQWLDSDAFMFVTYIFDYRAPGTFIGKIRKWFDQVFLDMGYEEKFLLFVGALFGAFGLKREFSPGVICSKSGCTDITGYSEILDGVPNPEYSIRVDDLPITGDTLLPIELYRRSIALITTKNKLMDKFYTKINSQSIGNLLIHSSKQYREIKQKLIEREYKISDYLDYGIDEIILNNVILYYNFRRSDVRSLFYNRLIRNTVYQQHNRKDFAPLHVLGVNIIATFPMQSTNITKLRNVRQYTVSDVMRRRVGKPSKSDKNLVRLATDAYNELLGYNIEITDFVLDEGYLFNKIIQQYRFEKGSCLSDLSVSSRNSFNLTKEMIRLLINEYFYNRLLIATTFMWRKSVVKTLLSSPDCYDNITKIEDIDSFLSVNDRSLYSVLNAFATYKVNMKTIVTGVLSGYFYDDECRDGWKHLHMIAMILTLTYTQQEQKMKSRSLIISRMIRTYVDCAISGCLKEEYIDQHATVKELLMKLVVIEYFVMLHTLFLPYNITKESWGKSTDELTDQEYAMFLHRIFKKCMGNPYLYMDLYESNDPTIVAIRLM